MPLLFRSCLAVLLALSTCNFTSGQDNLADRFTVPDGFRIECVADKDLTESLWAMTFDPDARLVVSRQKGPIVTLLDTDNDGRYDSAKPFSDQLTHSQGLTFVDGALYSIGEGPDFVGLYRLIDDDGDLQANSIETIGKFGSKGVGEHAPHGIVYGPDGMLYVVVGNHAQLPESVDPNSPFNNYYEGQLLPRYNDANGHATGILAPGGTVARIDLKTNQWTRVAGGFRNAYDIAFNSAGELFTYDSDMEWDERMPWYRPTRLNHVIPSGDYGWRHGSGKWPTYFADSLPTSLDLVRGSPCGVVFYHHHQFPEKYHGALFLCDWSRGRIVVVFTKPDGATYQCHAETFVTGRPLNVNDIEVGPDGALYFSIGGRNTEGGVYRIVYEGNQLATPKPLAPSAELAVTQPQPNSVWARARIRKIKNQLGSSWQPELLKIAQDSQQSAERRSRALTLLQQFGPAPTEASLIALSQDPAAQVRSIAVYLLGTHKSEAVRDALITRLKDSEPNIRRRSCEAFIRAGLLPPLEKMLSLLADNDRWLRFAARALLLRFDPSQYKQVVLQTSNPRIAVEGMLALVTSKPKQVQDLLDRQISILQSSPDDPLLLDALRLLQLTLIQEENLKGLKPIHPNLLALLEHHDWRIQREAARLAAFLDLPLAIPALLAQLESDIPWEQQIHYAYCLRTMKSGWLPELRQRLIAWFGRTREWTGGASFSGYLDLLWNDALKLLPPNNRDEVLTQLEKTASSHTSSSTGPSQTYNHKPDELKDFLLNDPTGTTGDVQQGRLAFAKAGCAVCHKFGTQMPGRGIGPDLTTVAARFKRHEILDSILNPSRVISDQYRAINVLTDDGRIVTGIPLGDDKTQLALKRTDGTEVTFPKEEVIRTSQALSMMPEGSLTVLSQQEIANLFAYLESGLENQ